MVAVSSGTQVWKAPGVTDSGRSKQRKVLKCLQSWLPVATAPHPGQACCRKVLLLSLEPLPLLQADLPRVRDASFAKLCHSAPMALPMVQHHGRWPSLYHCSCWRAPARRRYAGVGVGKCICEVVSAVRAQRAAVFAVRRQHVRRRGPAQVVAHLKNCLL